MAIDFSKGMTRKAPASKGKMTFEQAKKTSLKNLEAAIKAVKDYQKENGKLPTGNAMPAGLVKVGADGETCIGWRLANKPVFFNQESKDAYYPCTDWEADLRALAADIEAGKHTDVLVEAYDRPFKEPSPAMLAKRAARAEAKQNGQAHFISGGKTYVTKTGKIKK